MKNEKNKIYSQFLKDKLKSSGEFDFKNFTQDLKNKQNLKTSTNKLVKGSFSLYKNATQKGILKKTEHLFNINNTNYDSGFVQKTDRLANLSKITNFNNLINYREKENKTSLRKEFLKIGNELKEGK
jgi:hypothetical protein